MHGAERKHGMAMRGLVCAGVVAGLLAWSGGVYAAKPNPPGKEGGHFVVLPTGDVLAVTKPTILRWQQTPGTPGDTVSNCDNGNLCRWQEAVDYCAALGHGSRLAEVKELISLVDYSVANPADALNSPNGPFSNVQSAGYWTGTTYEFLLTDAWEVFFNTGVVIHFTKTEPLHAWCVR